MRLLTRPPAARLAAAPDYGITPRLAAIRLLRDKIADGLAGLDPYQPSDLIVVAHENESVWVNCCANLCGAVLYRQRQVGGGERFRIVLEADVRMELGLDVPEPPLMLDEPLASRGVDAPGIALDGILRTLPPAPPATEPVSLEALREAKNAYDRRYPHGAEPQLVIRTETPEAS